MNNSISIAALAEQLCRIEHKMDLVLASQAKQSPDTTLSPINSQAHICPVCLQNPTHNLDIFNGHVIRTCGCSTGKFPLNLAFAPGATPQGTDNNDE